jgi:epsilon-lactone hydrolase
VGPDGTMHIEAFDLPPSAGWSDEARKVFLKRFGGAPGAAASGTDRPVTIAQTEETWLGSQRAYRAWMKQLHRRLLNRIEEDHPCDVVEGEMNGVRVEWVTPHGGVRPEHADRVLVNLHGGAFVGGAEYCGLVESQPVADVGGYRICSVDYRQGWEHRFPAASEDVANVLTALQVDHAPSSIGIFGYSAGGMLTAQTVAWCLDKSIPLPGAVAICSASAGGAGDGSYLATVAMGGSPPDATSDDDTAVALGGHSTGVDPIDPLLAPIHTPEVLAGFPPTMLLNSTRSPDLSGALLTHRALLAQGVPAELHVWEGLWHCFPYNHRMPESQDAFRTLSDFFTRWLA